MRSARLFTIDPRRPAPDEEDADDEELALVSAFVYEDQRDVVVARESVERLGPLTIEHTVRFTHAGEAALVSVAGLPAAHVREVRCGVEPVWTGDARFWRPNVALFVPFAVSGGGRLLYVAGENFVVVVEAFTAGAYRLRVELLQRRGLDLSVNRHLREAVRGTW